MMMKFMAMIAGLHMNLGFCFSVCVFFVFCVVCLGLWPSGWVCNGVCNGVSGNL